MKGKSESVEWCGKQVDVRRSSRQQTLYNKARATIIESRPGIYTSGKSDNKQKTLGRTHQPLEPPGSTLLS
ncbi:hypothetical protein J6590_017979 [Homalodisca vitripennis]|nr:hypothetical protein J6590_017979 [Homalodisca vitripennis]